MLFLCRRCRGSRRRAADHSQEYRLPARKSVAETLRSSGTGLVIQGLNDHGNTLSAPDASRGQAVAQIVTAQFVQDSDDQARSRGAERVAERDGSAVYVGFVAIQSQNFFDGEILRGESFVDLYAIHLVDGQAGE